MTRKNLTLAQINDQSDQYLFRPVTYCKNSNTYLLRGDKSLSYTSPREILLGAITS